MFKPKENRRKDLVEHTRGGHNAVVEDAIVSGLPKTPQHTITDRGEDPFEFRTSPPAFDQHQNFIDIRDMR